MADPVGNATAEFSIPFKVTANSAYSAGQVVGGLITIPALAALIGKGGLIQSVTITDLDKQSASLEVWVFNAKPAGGATVSTDKSAFELDAADVGKVEAIIAVSTYFNTAAKSIGQALNQAAPFLIPAPAPAVQAGPYQPGPAAPGPNVSAIGYAIIVCRGTPTWTAVGNVGMTLRVLQD